MKYSIVMRDNGTKKLIERNFDQEWSNFIVNNWTKGNWECDCNRQIFFRNEEDVECGSSRYSALCAILEDGTIVSIDERIARE